jgi:transposase-like protein
MCHCPDCHTDQVIKNGSNGTGKPKYACKACGHQFVDDPQWRVISDDTKALIDRLLLERISLAGIAHLRQPVQRQSGGDGAVMLRDIVIS